MPTYEFRCPKGHDFEKFYKTMSAAPLELPCPECGAVATRQLSAGGGLLFKGSGFYLTDYGKNAHRGVAPDKKSESGGEGSKEGGKKEGAKAESGGAETGGAGTGKSKSGASEGASSAGGKSDGGKSDGGRSGGSDSKSSGSTSKADASKPKGERPKPK